MTLIAARAAVRRRARRRPPGSSSHCCIAAARSACWPRLTAWRTGPSSAPTTSACCRPSPPPPRPRSRPGRTSCRTRCRAASGPRRPSAAGGRASCTTRRSRSSAACGSCSRRHGAAPTPSGSDEALGPGLELVTGGIANLRALIADLRPAALDDIGTGAALERARRARPGHERATDRADGRPGLRGRARGEPPCP